MMGKSHSPSPAGRPIDAAEQIGRHLLADFFGVDAPRLRDAQWLCDHLVAALRQAGFHILEHRWHEFPGPHAGITAFVLLAESHAAIHTYPEHRYLALDIFTCGSGDPEMALRSLQDTLLPQRVDITCNARGRLSERSSE